MSPRESDPGAPFRRQADQRIAQLSRDVAVVKEDVAGVKQDVAAVKNDIKSVQTDMTESRMDRHGLRDDLAEIKSTLHDAEVQRALLMRIVKLLGAGVAALIPVYEIIFHAACHTK